MQTFETPPGLELASSFAMLQSLPGVQITQPKGIRVNVETYPVGAFARSPLLNGATIRLSSSQVLLVLRTQ